MTTQRTAHDEPADSAESEAVRRLSEAAIAGLSARRGPVSAESLAQALTEGPWLDELMDQVNGSGLRLTGEGGFLPALIKAVLEKGLAAELTDHLGYDGGDPAGWGSPNSRNGTTPKTLSTEVSDVELASPRVAIPPSSRSWWPRARVGWPVAWTR